MTISAIDSLLAQMRVAVAAAQGAAGTGAVSAAQPTGSSPEFSQVLKQALDQVAQTQTQAENLQQQFTQGNPAVSLSDAMMGLQKANISLQAAIQVRNRMVTAYNDIMNMQI